MWGERKQKRGPVPREPQLLLDLHAGQASPFLAIASEFLPSDGHVSWPWPSGMTDERTLPWVVGHKGARGRHSNLTLLRTEARTLLEGRSVGVETQRRHTRHPGLPLAAMSLHKLFLCLDHGSLMMGKRAKHMQSCGGQREYDGFKVDLGVRLRLEV